MVRIPSPRSANPPERSRSPLPTLRPSHRDAPRPAAHPCPAHTPFTHPVPLHAHQSGLVSSFQPSTCVFIKLFSRNCAPPGVGNMGRGRAFGRPPGGGATIGRHPITQDTTGFVQKKPGVYRSAKLPFWLACRREAGRSSGPAYFPDAGKFLTHKLGPRRLGPGSFCNQGWATWCGIKLKNWGSRSALRILNSLLTSECVPGSDAFSSPPAPFSLPGRRCVVPRAVGCPPSNLAAGLGWLHGELLGVI